MAEQRMLQDVPKADVIITNPEHFAVALKYDADTGTFILLAKAKALSRKKSKKSLLRRRHSWGSPLARALYFTTE